MKILLIYVNQPDEDIRESLISNELEINMVIESVYHDKIKPSDQTFFINYQNSEQFKEEISKIFPADSILLIPAFQENRVTDDTSAQLMNQTFHIMKQYYAPIMRLRGVSLWIIEPALPDNLDQSSNSLYHSTTAGLKAFSQILAMELARKKVTVNYLSRSNNLNSSIGNLLKWVNKRKNIYLTAQILNNDLKKGTGK